MIALLRDVRKSWCSKPLTQSWPRRSVPWSFLCHARTARMAARRRGNQTAMANVYFSLLFSTANHQQSACQQLICSPEQQLKYTFAIAVWLPLNDFNFNFINPEYINISLSTPNTCFSLTAMSGSEEMFSRKARDRLSGALTSAVEGTDILDGLPDLTAGLDSPLRRIVKYV